MYSKFNNEFSMDQEKMGEKENIQSIKKVNAWEMCLFVVTLRAAAGSFLSKYLTWLSKCLMRLNEFQSRHPITQFMSR